MRQIKFRGEILSSGEKTYGDLVQWGGHEEPRICSWINGVIYDVEPNSVTQLLCHDKNGFGIYDGDTIQIDFEKAANVIKDGLLLSTIKATKPTADAKLKVIYSHYRYRLIWFTHNGRSDTGVDLALIEPILPFVQVGEVT